MLSFLRHGIDAEGRPVVLACIAHFAGRPNEDYRVGLPFAGRWREVLNTDAASYGGSGVGNLGLVEADETPWHGRSASAALRLPPSGVLWLAPEASVPEVVEPPAPAVPAPTVTPVTPGPTGPRAASSSGGGAGG